MMKFIFAISLVLLTGVSHAQDIDWYRLIRSGDIAALAEHIETNGLSPNSVDARGRTLLRIAVERKQRHIILYLLRHPDLDINQRSEDGQSALHTAAYSNDLPHVRLLLKAGADPNLGNRHNETPLYTASFYGYADIAIEMLNHDGDLNIPNQDGDTALTHAPIATTAAIEEFLQSRTRKKAPTPVGSEPDTSAEQARAEQQRQDYIQQQTQARAEALQIHQPFIALIENDKKRSLRRAKKQLDSAGVTVVSANNQAFALKARFTRDAAPALSPLYGFVPVQQDDSADTPLEVSVNALYLEAIGNYLNLLDQPPPEADGNDSDTKKARQKLQRDRAESLNTYQALLVYDALVLTLRTLSLGEVSYDSEQLALTVTLLFAQHGSETFVIDGVDHDTGLAAVDNPEDLEWEIAYHIDADGFLRESVSFITSQTTLNAPP